MRQYNFDSKMKLLDKLTSRIITVGRVKSEGLAAEIARRWLNY